MQDRLFLSDLVEDTQVLLYKKLGADDQQALSLTSTQFLRFFKNNYDSILITQINDILTYYHLPPIKTLPGLHTRHLQNLLFAFQNIYASSNKRLLISKWLLEEETKDIKDPTFWKLALIQHMLAKGWRPLSDHILTVSSNHVLSIKELITTGSHTQPLLAPWVYEYLDKSAEHQRSVESVRNSFWLGALNLQNVTNDHRSQLLTYEERFPKEIAENSYYASRIKIALLCALDNNPAINKFMRLLENKSAVNNLCLVLDFCRKNTDLLLLMAYTTYLQTIKPLVASIKKMSQAEKRLLVEKITAYYVDQTIKYNDNYFVQSSLSDLKEKTKLVIELAQAFPDLDKAHTQIVVFYILTSINAYHFDKEIILAYLQSALEFKNKHPQTMQKIEKSFYFTDPSTFKYVVKFGYRQENIWRNLNFKSFNSHNFYKDILKLPSTQDALNTLNKIQLNALLKFLRSIPDDDMFTRTKTLAENNFSCLRAIFSCDDILFRNYLADKRISLDNSMLDFIFSNPAYGERIPRLGNAARWLSQVRATNPNRANLNRLHDNYQGVNLGSTRAAESHRADSNRLLALQGLNTSWLLIVLRLPITVFDIVCSEARKIVITYTGKTGENTEKTIAMLHFAELCKKIPLLESFSAGLENTTNANIYGNYNYNEFSITFDALSFAELESYRNMALNKFTHKEYRNLLEFMLVLFHATTERANKFAYIPLKEALAIIQMIINCENKEAVCATLDNFDGIGAFIANKENVKKSLVALNKKRARDGDDIAEIEQPNQKRSKTGTLGDKEKSQTISQLQNFSVFTPNQDDLPAFDAMDIEQPAVSLINNMSKGS